MPVRESVAVLPATPDLYYRVLDYADKKVKMDWDVLLMRSILAGVWVALYGHCSSVIGGYVYESLGMGMGKFVYGIIFPGALAAIFFTGGELYTGNSMALPLAWMEVPTLKNFLQIFRVLSLSLIGNFVGTFGSAFLISFLGLGFKAPGAPFAYLVKQAEAKVLHGNIGAILVQGVGCNLLVCLAVWSMLAAPDASGVIMTMWWPIAGFAMGGFEHVIANFWTLSTALFYATPGISVADVILQNWLPVFIGNTVAGSLVLAPFLYYSLSPDRFKKAQPVLRNELTKQFLRRVESHVTVAEAEEFEEGGNGLVGEVELQAAFHQMSSANYGKSLVPTPSKVLPKAN